MTAPNWSSTLPTHEAVVAKKCLDRLLRGVSPSDFGYRVQALAAHVLVGMGYGIREINHSGHPDIVALRNGSEFRFEVEAEVGKPRPRRLSNADLDSLTADLHASGYYALAISSPSPQWVVVPAAKLVGRPPIPNILLEALSDQEYSWAWTREYVRLLADSCRRISLAPYSHLSQMALLGRRLPAD